MHPVDAVSLILRLPRHGASDQPCHEANPRLWKKWCQLKQRDPLQPSDVWTEIDVATSCELMLRQYIRERVTGERVEQ